MGVGSNLTAAVFTTSPMRFVFEEAGDIEKLWDAEMVWVDKYNVSDLSNK